MLIKTKRARRLKKGNAFFTMGAPLVLPATNFTVGPNTPTVSDPTKSALAESTLVASALPKELPVSEPVEKDKKSPWLTILLAASAGALLTYYVTTKMAK